jgi:hypothetical protein
VSHAFKSNLLNSTAVIIIKVLAIAIERGVGGSVESWNIPCPRIPCPRSFIVLEKSLMNRTHCVWKIQVFPLFMRGEPPALLNSDNLRSPRDLEFSSLKQLSLDLPYHILIILSKITEQI